MNYSDKTGAGTPYPQMKKEALPDVSWENTKKAKKVYSSLEFALAILCLVLGYAFNKFVIGGKSPWIMSLVMLSAACVFVFFTLRLGGKINGAVAVYLAGAAVFSLSFVLCSSAEILFFCGAGAVFCLMLAIHKSFDEKIEKYPGVFFDADSIKALFAKPFSSFASIFSALFSKAENKAKASKAFLWTLLGLVVSIIPTAIVVSILSYDEGFASIISGMKLENIDFGAHIVSIIFAFPIAMYVFGLWDSSLSGKLASFDAENSKRVKSKIRCIPVPVVIAAVTPILIVYVIFFFSQLDYYVSAFKGELAGGYEIYSAFAREGFFELCAVSVINAAMVAFMYYFMKRKEKAILMRIYTIVISLFTLVLIATAISKMYLYIEAYGLTVTRVYTTAFMIVLALVFLFLIVRMITKRFNFVFCSLIAASLVLASFAVFDAPALISHYNTEKIIEGKNWTLDIGYYEDLGAAAVPDAVRIAENCSGKNRREAQKFLSSYSETLNEEDRGSFYMSIPEIKAKKALAGWKDE